MFGLLMPQSVKAAETPDITIKAEYAEHVAIPNVTFHLYSVATIDQTDNVVYQAPFDQLSLSTQPLSEENIQKTATTLADYVQAKNLVAAQTKQTNASGMLTFVLNDYQESGMIYLVLGENTTTKDNERLSFQPLLIQIPYQTNGNLHPILIPKPTKEQVKEKIDLSVLKVWKNDTTQTRPESITVGLYHEGKKEAEQVLNEENSWRHTFKDLTDDGKWQIIEETVPTGYTVAITESQKTLIITNTKTTTTPPSKTPPTTTSTTPRHLPQTGVLWWPVSVLSIMGGFLLVIGLIKRKTWLKVAIYLGLCSVSIAIGMTIYNLWDDYRAGQEVTLLNQQLHQQAKITATNQKEQPVWDQDMAMPSEKVENETIIGTLKIDKLNLELPILKEWSKDNSRLAPCRYTGSIYKNDLIIAGHNYLSHFAKLNKLTTGDHLSFQDMEGRTFEYEVSGIEMIAGSDVTAMQEGKWDLTLFTCNYDGTQRLTIRCNKVFEQGV